MNQWLTRSLLCAGLMASISTFADQDASLKPARPELIPASAPSPSSHIIDDPVEQQRAAYLAESIHVVQTALQYYTDSPSDQALADLRDAVQDYQAFSP